MTEIFVFRILKDDDFLTKKEQLLRFLPDTTSKFISRFKRTSAAQRSLFGEMLMRQIIGQRLGTDRKDIEIKKTKNGKPFLASGNLHFNLSHSGDYVVMALSNQEVGIDVEMIRPVNFRIAERFFSASEFQTLNLKTGEDKLMHFFDLWTLKESFLKLTGSGLTRSLNSFNIEFIDRGFRLSEKRRQNGKMVFFRQYPFDEGYRLSVCAYNNEFSETPTWITLNDLTGEKLNGK